MFESFLVILYVHAMKTTRVKLILESILYSFFILFYDRLFLFISYFNFVFGFILTQVFRHNQKIIRFIFYCCFLIGPFRFLTC